MYNRPVRIQVKPIKREKSRLKLINSFFVLVQLTFSYDFGFFNYKSFKTRLMFKIIAFFQCLTLCFGCYYFLYLNYLQDELYWYSYSVLAYFIYAMVLLLLSNERNSFYSFQRDLIAINADLGIDTKGYTHLEVKILFYFIFSFLFRTAILFVYCYLYEAYCLRPISLQVLYGIPLYGLDIPLIVNFFGYLSIYWSLKNVTDFVKNYDNDVLKSHYTYKLLYDYFEIIKTTLDAVTFLSLLFNIPSIMIMIYFTLADISKGTFDIYVHSAEYLVVLQEIVLTFAPPLAAGWVTSQANQIKLALQDRLLEERGLSHEADIKRFIKYIEARPFKLKVCQIIPLDSTLPVLIVNICVTYLIVIIQLTHLY